MEGCSFCLPIFIRSYFGGLTPGTINATLTFFKYGNKHYGVTCLHVIDILNTTRKCKNNYWYTLSLSLGCLTLNLSDMDPSDPEKRIDAFKPLDISFGEQVVDVVIAPINNDWWSLIKSEKAKQKRAIQAIDLDKWVEPKWGALDTMAEAYGYPTEHKTQDQGDVVSPCTTVCAERGWLTQDSTQLRLLSTLENLHGYFFSGMSGGPIFVFSDTNCYPIGIVYRGWPGSQFAVSESEGQGIFSEKDILIEGMIVTPDIFSAWLERCGLLQS